MKCSIKKFSEMYETVYRDLYRYALCLMKNPQEAEDAVSEAVVAAYENIHKLKKEEFLILVKLITKLSDMKVIEWKL